MAKGIAAPVLVCVVRVSLGIMNAIGIIQVSHSQQMPIWGQIKPTSPCSPRASSLSPSWTWQTDEVGLMSCWLFTQRAKLSRSPPLIYHYGFRRVYVVVWGASLVCPILSMSNQRPQTDYNPFPRVHSLSQHEPIHEPQSVGIVRND